MRELSWLAILLGVVIGALLAAANAFVGLKVGMTISASIPAAVISLLILRTLLKRGTLLESNIVQTIGSAGESVAAGMIFTIPALFIMGNDPDYLSMVIWGAIGGLLGVCFMVPLRRVLIVREHGKLLFPEGVACAEVLESGQRGGESAKPVIWGAIVGAAYYLVGGVGAWKETAVYSIRRIRTEAQLDSSPALLGIGYILGVRVAAYMLAGAVLSWFILIPAIGYFGAGSANVLPVTDLAIRDMNPTALWEAYIRYIGAGAVAIGGLISLCKSFPTIFSSFWHVVTGLFRIGRGKRDRTDRDFPFILLVLIVAGLGYAMYERPEVHLGHIGAIAVIVFAFFFVTVSSRLVGIVGSSSNPVSGMTIATLLATALVFKFFVIGDKTPDAEELVGLKIACLSAGAMVCIAISVAGDCSQDLKTGFLVKATPWKQQVGEMIGVLTSVLAIAGVLLLLNEYQGFVQDADHPYPLAAPQANIMKILVEGVLGGNVPWELIIMGGAAAVIVELLGLPALPFAVGMYLPLGLSTPIMVGGLVRWLVTRKKKETSEHDPGVLTASGMVAGTGLMGVAMVVPAAFIAWWWNNPRWANPVSGADEPVATAHVVPWLWNWWNSAPEGAPMSTLYWGLKEVWWKALPVLPFVLLTVWLWSCARKRQPMGPSLEPVTDGGPPPDATTGRPTGTPTTLPTSLPTDPPPATAPPAAPPLPVISDEPREAPFPPPASSSQPPSLKDTLLAEEPAPADDARWQAPGPQFSPQPSVLKDLGIDISTPAPDRPSYENEHENENGDGDQGDQPDRDDQSDQRDQEDQGDRVDKEVADEDTPSEDSPKDDRPWP